MSVLPHWPEELFRVDRAPRVARWPRRPLPLGPQGRLTDLAKHYQFFTPGPAYLLADFDDHLLAQFSAEQAQDLELYEHVFHQPLFLGMSQWNNRLWAVKHETWLPLANFFLSLGIRNPQTGRYSRLATQDLEILDPTSLEPKTLGVVILGVQTTEYIAGLVPQGFLGPPALRLLPPQGITPVLQEQTRLLAQDEVPVAPPPENLNDQPLGDSSPSSPPAPPSPA